MSGQPPEKRRRLELFEEFKLVVGKGDEQKTVTVAKAYLVKSSDYLKTACSKKRREGQTKFIELPDTDPDTFAIYLQYLQTGELVLTDEEMPAQNSDASIRIAYWHAGTAKIIDLYVLADYLADTAMRNLVIDESKAAASAMGYCPDLRQVKRAYQSTTPNSTLRGLFVDWYVANAPNEWIADHGIKCHPEFLVDMLTEFTRLRDEQELPTCPGERGKCYYHEHDEEHPECT